MESFFHIGLVGLRFVHFLSLLTPHLSPDLERSASTPKKSFLQQHRSFLQQHKSFLQQQKSFLLQDCVIQSVGDKPTAYSTKAD
jgi:hypothetical protein